MSAPLIAPKKSPSRYIMMIDYRPINKATVRSILPVLHLDAIIDEFSVSKAFAMIDFSPEYWPLQIDSECQPLHAFMNHEGIIQPTHTTQGGCNRAANFQEFLEPCFCQLRGQLFAWWEDFALYDK